MQAHSFRGFQKGRICTSDGTRLDTAPADTAGEVEAVLVDLTSQASPAVTLKTKALLDKLRQPHRATSLPPPAAGLDTLPGHGQQALPPTVPDGQPGDLGSQSVLPADGQGYEAVLAPSATLRAHPYAEGKLILQRSSAISLAWDALRPSSVTLAILLREVLLF